MQAPRMIHVVDPVHRTRAQLMARLARADHAIRTFVSVDDYVRGRAERADCVLAAISAGESDTLALSRAAAELIARTPVVYLARDADIRLAVNAMKAGAFDFVCGPPGDAMLDEILPRAFLAADRWLDEHTLRTRAHQLVGRLTPRERTIFAHVLRGERNKQIAAALDSREATVKVHRSRLMRKLGARTLADLVHIGRAAEV